MGSGDPSGLQNRRELALLALVSSTLTRFRHLFVLNNFNVCPALSQGSSISVDSCAVLDFALYTLFPVDECL